MSHRIVDHETARRAAIVATIWIPLAIVIVAEIVVIGIGASGGGDLIVHWGSDADRTGPWWTYAVLVGATGFPVVALFGYFVARGTRMSGMNAWMPAIAMGVTVFHAVGMGVGAVVFNASPLAPGLPLAGGVVLAIAAALLTWRLLPQEAASEAGVRAAEALPVRPGEVVAWTGRADLPGWFATLLAGVAGLMLMLYMFLLLTRGSRLWPMLFVPAFLFLVLLATAHFAVTAGPRGLVVRSALGWPRFRVPLADIAKAGVAQVEPMADFGGWGIRWVVGPNGKGRWGVVTRRGPALEVVRRDGRSIVVTVDEAATAAAVLETCAGS